MLPVSVSWVLTLTALNMISFAFGFPQPARLVVALVFVLTCPGVVLVDLLRITDLAGRAATAVCASLAVNVQVVTVLLMFDEYSVERALVTVTLLTFGAALYTSMDRLRVSALGPSPAKS